MVEVCASSAAFSALKEDGSVVSWGDRAYGGDGSASGVASLVGILLMGQIGVESCYNMLQLRHVELAPYRR